LEVEAEKRKIKELDENQSKDLEALRKQQTSSLQKLQAQ
jgi:hypothetical protein